MITTSSIKLLLVEDDRSDVFMFQSAIDECSINYGEILVAVCRTIEEAERALSEQKYDLILLDMYVPDSSGLEGFKRLILLFPEIPIVIHSGVYNPGLASEAIALGAQDYIVKGTMSNEDLVRTLVHAKMRHEVHRRLQRLAVV